ncbi:hypothetical protein VV869_10835 [Photobacterium sp. MCCC 1A19761]|uniref:hypothetical protein n=1 Tax=Photobacterium sp. MCCC 1A19761 TaxID=3115000 RepID=UPI00307D8E10
MLNRIESVSAATDPAKTAVGNPQSHLRIFTAIPPHPTSSTNESAAHNERFACPSGRQTYAKRINTLFTFNLGQKGKEQQKIVRKKISRQQADGQQAIGNGCGGNSGRYDPIR